jgi:hypothetical protein
MSLAIRGLTETPNSSLERVALRHGVPADDEYRRIDSLPRRKWTERQIQTAQRKLTALLRTKRGSRELWPDQAKALSEIQWYGGIVGGIRVSGGKTTIAFLAATLLPDCPRPLLIVPNKSIKSGKVATAYAEERKHWKVRRDYSWISYHDLQRKSNANYLNNLKPGLIIFDEAHHVGRYNSSRTKRVRRYLRDNPEVVCIVLTGSLIASRVVNDSLTLCDWARREHSPLPAPSAKKTQRYWKLALGVPQRTEPGVLRRWCRSGESTVAGVGRRYHETPGVVCSSGENVIGTSLSINTQLVRALPPSIEAAFTHVRANRNPDGSELLDSDGGNTWLLAQTLALGFYYVFDPKPPPDWLDAYRNWCAYCREHIEDESCECDTESQVTEHIVRDGDECWPYEEWLPHKGSFQLRRKPVWCDYSRVHAASRWMDVHKHGIVWTQFRAFGEALAVASKRPYYASGAKSDNTGEYITRHKAGTACIASIATCSEDLNLQRQFYENLFVSPPGTGAHMEQAIARSHRFGCAWDEVTVDMWIACAENRDNLKMARLREKQAAEMTGDESRKLIIGDWTQARLTNISGPQWTKKRIARELMQ